MKKIIIYTIVCMFSFTGCADFLATNPDKSGNSTINHMDQLYGLMGDAYNYVGGSYLWSELLLMTDDCEISPYMYSKLSNNQAYLISTWDRSSFEDLKGISSWSAAYTPVFDFNTVLEYLDKVQQTTLEIKEQVRGEALFGRAYFQFFALVMYSKYDNDAPGIGYRDNTLPPPDGIPSRMTVKYTINRIIKDLDDAEKALISAGRTKFEFKRNFRITLPTLHAFKARVALYIGDYTMALKSANVALDGYNVLLDFKKDPLYEIKNSSNINILDENGQVTGKLPFYEMNKLGGKADAAIPEYVEMYLPHVSKLYYSKVSMPISESLFNLFEKDNDERWKRFYNNNYCIVKEQAFSNGGFKYADQQNLKENERHTYYRFRPRFGVGSKVFVMGPTTAEMYLIKAECSARLGDTKSAKEALQTLRRTRFTTMESADNIQGTVEDVLNERRMDLAGILRWYDIKRLNGKENANIILTKKRHSDPGNINSPIIDVKLLPNDPFYAVPIPLDELILMGWEQNK